VGLIEEFKRGYEGRETERFAVNGLPVACSHCGGTTFQEGEALLNTPGMTFFGIDWANRSAALLICTKCGHIEWFLNEPEAD